MGVAAADAGSDRRAKAGTGRTTFTVASTTGAGGIERSRWTSRRPKKQPDSVLAASATTSGFQIARFNAGLPGRPRSKRRAAAQASKLLRLLRSTIAPFAP
jgi:hypothetical protein